MIHRFILVAVLGLFGIFICKVAYGQTPDAPTKNCTPPRPTYREDPPPPRRFGKIEKITAVAINVSIDENGAITDASILKSSGDDKFDKASLQAAKKWKFEPSLCDGKSSTARITIEIQAKRLN